MKTIPETLDIATPLSVELENSVFFILIKQITEQNMAKVPQPI